jgi:hypothetical protein
MAVNDHVLKVRWPGTLTGKLSDLAGLIFFPLVVVALLELVARSPGRDAPPRVWLLSAVVVGTGLIFATAEVSPVGARILGEAWGVARAPIAGPLRLGNGPVVFTPDLTDLLALPMLAVAWLIGRRHLAERETSRD